MKRKPKGNDAALIDLKQIQAEFDAMTEEEKRARIARDAARILAPHIQAMLTPDIVAAYKAREAAQQSPAPQRAKVKAKRKA